MWNTPPFVIAKPLCGQYSQVWEKLGIKVILIYILKALYIFHIKESDNQFETETYYKPVVWDLSGMYQVIHVVCKCMLTCRTVQQVLAAFVS